MRATASGVGATTMTPPPPPPTTTTTGPQTADDGREDENDPPNTAMVDPDENDDQNENGTAEENGNTDDDVEQARTVDTHHQQDDTHDTNNTTTTTTTTTNSTSLDETDDTTSHSFFPLRRYWSEATGTTNNTSMPSPLLSRRDSIVSTVYVATNFFGTVANLCSATLGAGILALPYALYQAGLIWGGLLLLISAWATSSSIALLVQACDRHRLPTYETIVEQMLGRRARTVVEWSILIFCCGTAVGYVIAVGDILERMVYMTAPQRKLAMITVWSISMLPLSCLRRMKSLQCASAVGIASIGTLLAAAIVHLVRPAPDKEDYEELEDADVMVSMASMANLLGPAHGSWLSVLQACPIFFYAFSCQVNVAQIYEELPGPYGNDKIRTMGWVTWAAVAICAFLYASISLVTLMDFGQHVTPNILSSYDLAGAAPLLHLAFLAMALAVIMAFPLNIFPARVSLIQMWETDHHGEPLLCGGQDEEAKQPLLSTTDNVNASNNDNELRPTLDYSSGGETPPREARVYDPLRSPLHAQMSVITDGGVAGDGGEDEDSDEETPDFHVFQHTSVTFLLAGLALGLALVVPNISIVFGLLGGTTSSLLGFIVPGLLGLQLDRKSISAWILVVAGSVIGLLTTSVTVYSTFHAITR